LDWIFESLGRLLHLLAETRIYLACASVLDWFQPIRPVSPSFCFLPSFYTCLRQPLHPQSSFSIFSAFWVFSIFDLTCTLPFLPPSFAHLTSPNRLVTFKHSFPSKGVSQNNNITNLPCNFPPQYQHHILRGDSFLARHSYKQPLLRAIAIVYNI
jgi:hypothetical protein